MKAIRTTGTVVILFFVMLTDICMAGKSCSSPGSLCVGLVTDVGVIDDKSFNESSWEGVTLSKQKLGTRVKYIETRDAKDYKANIRLFAENGYNVIVTVGFGLGEATNAAAIQYPHIKFIGIDQFQPKVLPNVAGLVFHEKKAGFKAGALAALLTKTNIISAVLATDMVPPVIAFKKGFESGARYINPEIKIISSFHPGGLDVAFTDPEWGASTTRQAISQGADVIFGAGGLTGNGALIEAASAKGVYCIGVDQDQFETLPAARPCLVSCAQKFIAPAVFELISLAAQDAFPSGNYFGEVGLSSFHTFEKDISDDVRQKLKEIDEKLKDGAIKL